MARQEQAAAVAEATAWFAEMVGHCLEHAHAAKAEGRPVVGILCEFAPRELILAADGVPVCLCGGSAAMVAAAEEFLPANLCPLIKSTFGYHARQANPFLEMADLVVAETTCDGKKKMFELMAGTRPMHVMELPHRADEPAAFAAWLAEVRRLARALEERFGVSLTAAPLREAAGLMNRERRLRRRLAALMQRPAPPFTGRQLLDWKSLISGLPADLACYERLLAQLESAPAADALGPQPARLLLTGVPLVHGAERVLDLIEAHGGLVVCQENCTGLKPLLEDVDEAAADPLEAIARKYYRLPCSVLTPNPRRRESITRLAAEYRAQGVVELVWQACLTYDVESYWIRQTAAGLGLPYLRIETDYSPADSARIATRVEALVETIRERPAP